MTVILQEKIMKEETTGAAGIVWQFDLCYGRYEIDSVDGGLK